MTLDPRLLPILGLCALAVVAGAALWNDPDHERRRRRMVAAARPHTASDRAAPTIIPVRGTRGIAGLAARFGGVVGRNAPGLDRRLLAALCAATAAIVLFLLRAVAPLPWWLAAPTAAAAAVAAPLAVASILRQRRRDRFLDHFPDAIELVVRAVRAGLPVGEAITACGRDVPGPVGEEFRRIRDQIQIGITLDEALRQASERIGVADFRIFVVSLSLQRETGGNLAEALSNLAQVIRRRRELRLKAGALSSEAKASALVIGTLPFFAGAALSMTNPHYFTLFATDPRGGYLIGAAAASLTIGAVVMRWMIRRSVS